VQTLLHTVAALRTSAPDHAAHRFELFEIGSRRRDHRRDAHREAARSCAARRCSAALLGTTTGRTIADSDGDAAAASRRSSCSTRHAHARGASTR
jgi:hypothetical protein